MPSGHSKPSHPLGRLTVFPSPPITRRQTQASVPGGAALPKAAPSRCETPAAMMARPSWRGHLTNALLPPRGAKPTPRPPAAGLSEIAERAPGWGEVKQPRPPPAHGGESSAEQRGSPGRGGGGKRQQHGLPLLPSPTPHHFLTVAMARPPAASP